MRRLLLQTRSRTPTRSNFSFIPVLHHSSNNFLCARVFYQMVLLALSMKDIPFLTSSLSFSMLCTTSVFILDFYTIFLTCLSASTLTLQFFSSHRSQSKIKYKFNLITTPSLKPSKTPSRPQMNLPLPNFQNTFDPLIR